jgi:hypothetical protein
MSEFTRNLPPLRSLISDKDAVRRAIAEADKEAALRGVTTAEMLVFELAVTREHLADVGRDKQIKDEGHEHD